MTMNTKTMNGKLISWVQWPHGLTVTADDTIGFHFEGTYHGDRDEFWIVESDGRGFEIKRHNPRFVESWEWVEPIAPVEKGQSPTEV